MFRFIVTFIHVFGKLHSKLQQLNVPLKGGYLSVRFYRFEVDEAIGNERETSIISRPAKADPHYCDD